MSDLRGAYDEDSLPWLQEVEDEDAPTGISARTMLFGIVAVLVIAAAVAAAFFWLGNRAGQSGGGEPQLIRAPEGPYKVKPENPGGLDVAGDSQTTFETSAGVDIDSRLNLPQEPAEQPQRLPPNETREPVPAEETAPAPAPEPVPPKAQPAGAAGSVVQLGAFANRAQAERAWTSLSGRFSSVAGLNKMVVPFSGGIRLRAAASSPAEARQVCEALKAAGEACFIAR